MTKFKGNLTSKLGADSTVGSVACVRVPIHLMCATDREKQLKPTKKCEFTWNKLIEVPHIDFGGTS